MDSLQGSIPSVILFPATWNATLLLNKNDALRNAFRQIIGSLSVTSTVTMVGSSILNNYHVHSSTDRSNIPEQVQFTITKFYGTLFSKDVIYIVLCLSNVINRLPRASDYSLKNRLSSRRELCRKTFGLWFWRQCLYSMAGLLWSPSLPN